MGRARNRFGRCVQGTKLLECRRRQSTRKPLPPQPFPPTNKAFASFVSLAAINWRPRSYQTKRAMSRLGTSRHFTAMQTSVAIGANRTSRKSHHETVEHPPRVILVLCNKGSSYRYQVVCGLFARNFRGRRSSPPLSQRFVNLSADFSINIYIKSKRSTAMDCFVDLQVAEATFLK
jgi:hypothetical protein